METAERIGLVACVKSKRGVASPASQLYISPLFQKSKRWAERHCDRWFVLSAKYGLVHPDEVIEPYEQTLDGTTQAVRRTWAQQVFQSMASLGLPRPGTTFVWLAGQAYEGELGKLLAAYRQEHPLKGLKLGPRMSWLDAHLND